MRREGPAGGAAALAGRIRERDPDLAVVAVAGEEGFLRDEALRALLAAALGDPESPHAVILHGPARQGDPDPLRMAAVLEECRTLPMFAPPDVRKVVVVRRADALLAAEGKALTGYLEAPAPRALLLLSADALPREAAAALGSSPRATVLSCEAPRAEPAPGGGPSPLAHWVAGRARERGKDLDPRDAEVLVHRSGTNLAVLDGAVGAAALHAGDAPRIAVADLEAVAPTGPAEPTDRFVEGVLARDAGEALRVLAGLYREGAWAWGSSSPVRGDGPVTHFLVGQLRRVARDAYAVARLREEGRFDRRTTRLPGSLYHGCRDPWRVLERSDAPGLRGLLARLTGLEADLKGGSGAERARFEALVVGYAEGA